MESGIFYASCVANIRYSLSGYIKKRYKSSKSHLVEAWRSKLMTTIIIYIVAVSKIKPRVSNFYSRDLVISSFLIY
jgi:hypothetical protein